MGAVGAVGAVGAAVEWGGVTWISPKRTTVETGGWSLVREQPEQEEEEEEEQQQQQKEEEEGEERSGWVYYEER